MANIHPEEEIDIWNIPESTDLNMDLFTAPLGDAGNDMLAADPWYFDSSLSDASAVPSTDPAWNQLEDAWKYCQYDPSLWQPLSPEGSQSSSSVPSIAAPAMGLDPLASYQEVWPSLDDFSMSLSVAGPSAPLAPTFSPAGTPSPTGFGPTALRSARTILPKSTSPPYSPGSVSQSSASSTPPAASGRASPSLQLPCPYPDCGRTFATQGQLRAHEKRHTKPYACKASGCDKRYGAKEDLNRHLCQDHGDVAASLGIRKKERSCRFCPYRSRIDNVKRHERTCSRRPR